MSYQNYSLFLKPVKVTVLSEMKQIAKCIFSFNSLQSSSFKYAVK